MGEDTTRDIKIPATNTKLQCLTYHGHKFAHSHIVQITTPATPKVTYPAVWREREHIYGLHSLKAWFGKFSELFVANFYIDNPLRTIEINSLGPGDYFFFLWKIFLFFMENKFSDQFFSETIFFCGKTSIGLRTIFWTTGYWEKNRQLPGGVFFYWKYFIFSYGKKF